MDLQDRLTELSAYNAECVIKNGFMLISLRLPSEWVVAPPNNKFIEHEASGGMYHYCAPIDKVSSDELFEVINTTISYNIEIEDKCKLFAEKLNELKELFREKDLEALQTLKFAYDEDEENGDSVKNGVQNNGDSVKNEETVTKPKRKGRKKVTEETISELDENDPIAKAYLRGEVS